MSAISHRSVQERIAMAVGWIALFRCILWWLYNENRRLRHLDVFYDGCITKTGDNVYSLIDVFYDGCITKTGDYVYSFIDVFYDGCITKTEDYVYSFISVIQPLLCCRECGFARDSWPIVYVHCNLLTDWLFCFDWLINWLEFNAICNNISFIL